MLQNLREKTSGWIATVVLGLLIVPFAFVGVSDYFQQTRERPVASIGAPPTWWADAPTFWPFSALWEHQDVTQRDFRDRFEQARQTARQEQGVEFDAREFESVDNKRKVLDALIDERVQGLWAQRQGIVVSDAMVRREIAQIPAFQRDGKFDLQQYRLAVRTLSPPRTEAQFEQLVRDGLADSMLRTSIGSSSFATASETSRLIALLGERRDVSVIALPAAQPDTAAVTAAEIDAWYRSHIADYRAPETVTLEYVELDARRMDVGLREQPPDAAVAGILATALHDFGVRQHHPALVQRDRLLAKPQLGHAQRQAVGAVGQDVVDEYLRDLVDEKRRDVDAAGLARIDEQLGVGGLQRRRR